MRVYTKYKSSRARRKKPSRLYWLLAAAGFGLAGWLFWRTVVRPKPAPAARPQPIAPAQPVVAPTGAPLAVVGVPGSRTQTVAFLRTNLPLASLPMGTNLVRALEPFSPRPVQDILEAQIALARRGLSPGSVDGAEGSQTRAALAAFQRKEKLVATARLDAATKGQLILDAPGLTNYTISLDDLARLVPVSRTWQGKSEQGRLDYENILELVAEKSCSSPKLIRRLNPTVDWDNVTAGMVVVVPDTSLRPAVGASAFVRISLSGRTLDVFDAETNLLAHFPCSIAARVEKRPLGDLHVAAVAHNPNYTFDPDIFPESAEARGLGRKLVLPPGPNNPVGTAWVGLDRAGYGIHGTPRPEEVGRTESHGCFRLANWNAELLARLVSIGTPVLVEY